jgi:hypothetical protein
MVSGMAEKARLRKATDGETRREANDNMVTILRRKRVVMPRSLRDNVFFSLFVALGGTTSRCNAIEVCPLTRIFTNIFRVVACVPIAKLLHFFMSTLELSKRYV